MSHNQSNLIAFVHIPKAGGTTFTNVLDSVFGDQLLVAQPKRGWPQEWPTETLREIGNKKNYFRAFSGHSCFGIHELFGRPTTYLSSVRNPIDRFESYYNFVRHWKIHHHYLAAQSRCIGEFFRYLLEIEDIELFNLQCLMLGNEKRYQTAQKHIEDHFFAVTPVELFDESLKYLSDYFEWNVQEIPISNKTTHMSSVLDLTDRDFALLSKGNQEDMDLYEYCMEEMQQTLTGQRKKE